MTSHHLISIKPGILPVEFQLQNVGKMILKEQAKDLVKRYTF